MRAIIIDLRASEILAEYGNEMCSLGQYMVYGILNITLIIKKGMAGSSRI